MTPSFQGKEISVSGRLFKTARLRHEWCDFLSDSSYLRDRMAPNQVRADLFTFIEEIGEPPCGDDHHSEQVGVAVLPVTTHKQWWDDIGFKPRNKIRKGQKSGIEVRIVSLDEEFARGVEAIYNESSIRQGRKFFHYGQTAAEIHTELSSFLDRSILVGAYFQGELLGFTKLFKAAGVLRTIHIIARLAHREKCVMDVLIDKAVQLCEEHKARYLHYGSWTDGGIGAFRTKFGFQRMEVPRYFVPLSWRGELMLGLSLHQPMRDRLPKGVADAMIKARTKWNSLRYAEAKGLAEG